MDAAPRFEVRAVGAQKQKPGCPDFSEQTLDAARLEALCKGECFNPSDERKLITRIEVVRIRPQTQPGEPVARPASKTRGASSRASRARPAASCSSRIPTSRRRRAPAAYYVRAIEEPSPTVNARNLRCKNDARATA